MANVKNELGERVVFDMSSHDNHEFYILRKTGKYIYTGGGHVTHLRRKQ